MGYNETAPYKNFLLFAIDFCIFYLTNFAMGVILNMTRHKRTLHIYMSLFNKTDVKGCIYTMEILSNYSFAPIKWEHTSINKNDEYCKYDMDWFATAKDGNVYSYVVENKDRRINWDTKEPQYISTYPSVMFNIEKYNELMKISNTEGKIPLYTADYADGVAVFDLRKFPSNCTEIWREKRRIGKNTVENGEKIPQYRMMIPKEYYYFFPNNPNDQVIRPFYTDPQNKREINN